MNFQVYKFVIPLSCRKELLVALFKNWINLLETKSYFFTYLPFRLFLTEKILFLSNIFIFRNQNIKFHMCIFLFFILSNGLFICLLFKSLKTVLLCLMKSNCCIYFHISQITAFLFFVFNGYLGVKTNVLKTGLLSFYYWYLWLVWVHLIHCLTKAGSFK